MDTVCISRLSGSTITHSLLTLIQNHPPSLNYPVKFYCLVSEHHQAAAEHLQVLLELSNLKQNLSQQLQPGSQTVSSLLLAWGGACC